MKHSVYLAGPITGCTYRGCTGWREYAQRCLDSETTKCKSPMRTKNFWAPDEIVDNSGLSSPMASARGILCRDHNDCVNASVLLVNFKEAEKISIGTVMEIAWAYERRIPIVVVLPVAVLNIHQHDMLDEAIDYAVADLDVAIAIARTIIGEDA